MARRPDRKLYRRLRRLTLLVLITVVVLLVRFYDEIGQDVRPEDRFMVVRILDGDTIEFQGGDRLRLLGLDTPEQGERLHDNAAQLLERLVLGKIGRLEYAGRRRDRYGRLLAYLYVDSLLINKAIIDSGLGYLYLFKDNDLAKPEIAAMMRAQQQAIMRQVGLWSLSFTAEPFYVSTASSFRLHRPSCRSISELPPHRQVIYETRVEGLATGLSPCRNCKP